MSTPRWPEYRDAFVPEDRRGKVIGDIHLCDVQTSKTACGMDVQGIWISRSPGPFYGRRRVAKGERLCPSCKAVAVASTTGETDA